ncbi:hypothetical protein N9R54_04580 [Pelobium sp.]|nr:hypothetical protein [Pelobium sp.]MDA9555491.1 hypothetical protein [Pelobium sp.]
MKIPSNSSVLISGIHPVSLAFASILGVCGVKVLMIDEAATNTSETVSFKIDYYSFELLKHLGFDLADSEEFAINQADFIKQSLKILATNLCSVIWNTQLQAKPKANDNTYLLKHDDEIITHQSQFFYTLDDLLIDELNARLNFRNNFLLAWRLLGILEKNLKPKILYSYPKETELLKAHFTNREITKNPFQKLLNKLSTSKKQGLHLIDSSISIHLSQHRDIEAGEILPDLAFYDEQLKAPSSLYKWCNYRHFSVFFFGHLTSSHLFTIAKWIQLNYKVQLFYLPPSEKNQSVFDAFQIREGERKTLIIRPDRYIGLINDAIDIDIIDNYLNSVLGMRAKAE